MIQKITPCLSFDDHAEEAVKTYTSIFKDSRMGRVTRYEEESAKASGRPAGTVMTVDFSLPWPGADSRSGRSAGGLCRFFFITGHPSSSNL